jgi:hypothetical protein
MQETIVTPNTEHIEVENGLILNTAQSLAIVTHGDYMDAGEKLKSIKRAQKQVVELFAEAKAAANRAHKEITKAESKLLTPLKTAEQICSQKVSIYLVDLRKREQEEIIRLRKEADEAAKIEAEKQKKIQDDERIKAAEQLQSQGFKEEADLIMNQEVPAPLPMPIYVQPIEQKEKVKGLHLRTTYKAEVVDFMLLVKEVAAGRQPSSFLMANEKTLNDMASTLKQQLKIPGVIVVEQSKPVARTNI